MINDLPDGNIFDEVKAQSEKSQLERDFLMNIDGTVLCDHKSTPVTVSRFLATKPLRSEVSTRKGPCGIKLSYMSGDIVTRILNEAFGYDGWCLEVKNTAREDISKDDKGRYNVAYIATVRITHRRTGAYREDCGAGDAIDKSLGSASGNALKGAITDAMKRAARHFGEKLGNSLYHEGFDANRTPLTLKDSLDALDIEISKRRFGDRKNMSDYADVTTSTVSNHQFDLRKNDERVSPTPSNAAMHLPQTTCKKQTTAPHLHKETQLKSVYTENITSHVTMHQKNNRASLHSDSAATPTSFRKITATCDVTYAAVSPAELLGKSMVDTSTTASTTEYQSLDSRNRTENLHPGEQCATSTYTYGGLNLPPRLTNSLGHPSSNFFNTQLSTEMKHNSASSTLASFATNTDTTCPSRSCVPQSLSSKELKRKSGSLNGLDECPTLKPTITGVKNPYNMSI